VQAVTGSLLRKINSNLCAAIRSEEPLLPAARHQANSSALTGVNRTKVPLSCIASQPRSIASFVR
jgi:hypothetical protein